jgi:hypothetical protein
VASANDLISFAEAQDWIDAGSLHKKRDLVESIIWGASQVIEDYLGRNLVTRGAITEYHWLKSAEWELYLSQFPTITVTSVHEDSSRGYGASYLLTADTDYVVDSATGRLIRTSSATSGTTSWMTGFEAVKVVYTAGYATTASIPAAIKDVCKRHVREIYSEVTRKLGGISDVSDAMGTIKRYGPPMLTSGMRRDLFKYRQLEFSHTWTRISVA